MPIRDAEVDQVMDRDHRRAGQERRAHVVRRVEELRAIASGPQREPPELGHRVRARALSDPLDPAAPQGRGDVPPRGPVDHQLLGTRQGRVLAEQPPDVRPDPEVVELSGVERDPHPGPPCTAV